MAEKGPPRRRIEIVNTGSYIKPLGKIPVARVVRRRFGFRSGGAAYGPSGPRRECAVNSRPRSGGELRRGGFAGPSIEITHGFQKSKGRCNRFLQLA